MAEIIYTPPPETLPHVCKTELKSLMANIIGTIAKCSCGKYYMLEWDYHLKRYYWFRMNFLHRVFYLSHLRNT